MPIAGTPDVKLRIGGKTEAGGAKPGIYRVRVNDASIDASAKKGTPFIKLELHVKKDPEHPEKEGKKLMNAMFYGPNPSTSESDQNQAAHRMKKSLFTPLKVAWPETDANLDPRVFVGKEFFVLVDMGKPNDKGESYPEVKRLALKKEELPKLKGDEATEDDGEAADSDSEAASDDGEAEAKPQSKPAAKRR